MGWRDSLAGFDQAVTSGVSTYRPPGSSSGNSGNWMSTFSAAVPKSWKPPPFPKSLSIPTPWSSASAKPAPIAKDTSGDFLGSLGASFSNAVGEGGFLNLANAIPWAMERGLVLAKELANTAETNFMGIPQAIDTFAEGVKLVSEPVAKAMEWFPNTVRNSTLNARTAMYAALVTGQHVDPLQTLGTTNLGFGFQNTLQGQIEAIDWLSDQLSGGRGAPPEKLAQARTILSKMIDLPESVKREIEQNPKGDFGAYLDKAPEGRNFSYAKGYDLPLLGNPVNFLGTGMLYAIELLGSSGLAAVARGGSLAARVPTVWDGGVAGLKEAGLAATGVARPAGLGVKALQGAYQAANATRVGQAALKGVSTFAKIQKVSLAAGISYFPATVLTDAVLRTMGNKAGVAYLDSIQRTALISDSPAVQLVTSFSVDPIAALGAARKGMLLPIRGAPIVIDKLLGRRLSTLYTHETYVLDRVAAMFATDRKGAEALIADGTTYDTMGQAFDNILELAANSAIDKLSEGAKAVINTLPREQRTAAVFSRYPKEVLYELDHPEGALAQFRRDWPYHDLHGNFDPEIAKLIVRDNRQARLRLHEAMMEMDAVAGYVEYLNPEGQGLVAGYIDDFFANGQKGTLHDLNFLIVKHPSMRGLVKDLVAQGTDGKPFVKPTDLVPRSVFDEALRRATENYDAAFAANPHRVATGRDPVLRPGVHPSDWALAFNTGEDTMAALWKVTGRTSAEDNLVAAFARERKILTDTELATLTPDEVWLKATDHMEKVSEPWVVEGERVAGLEAQVGAASERLRELREVEPPTATSRFDSGQVYRRGREIDEAQVELDRLQQMLATIRDPTTPFSATLPLAVEVEGSAAVANARHVIEVKAQVDAIKAIDDAIKPAQDLVWGTPRPRLFDSVERGPDGKWRWVAESRTIEGPLFTAALDFYFGWRWPAARTVKGKGFTRRWVGRNKDAIGLAEGTPVEQAHAMAASPGFVDHLREPVLSTTPWIRRSESYGNKASAEAAADEVRLRGPAEPYGPRDPSVSQLVKWDVRVVGQGKRWAIETQEISELVGETAQRLEVANMIEAGKRTKLAAPEITDEMIAALTPGGTREAFIERVGSLRDAREAALDGSTLSGLERTAGRHVDPWALEYARKTGKVAAVFDDPGAEVAHLTAQHALKTALASLDTFPGVRAIVEGDPHLLAAVQEVAERAGTSVDDLLSTPSAQNIDHLGAVLPAVLDPPYVPGAPVAMTPFDEAVIAGSAANVEALKIQMADIAGTLKPPIKDVPLESLDAFAQRFGSSVQLADDLNAQGIHWQALIPESLLNRSPAGRQALSMLNVGRLDQPPRTVGGLLTLLKEIENGNAARMGMGTQLAAEAQQLGRDVVASMIGVARKANLEIGVIGMGKGLNPKTWSADVHAMISELFGQVTGKGGGRVVFTGENGLQYGLKARPKGAVAVDMASLPAGFAEEFLSGHFRPWNERMAIVRVRQAYNRIFGPIANQQIYFEARGRFETRMAAYGVPAKASELIWTAWRDAAKKSRPPKWRRNAAGERVKVESGSALYATERNIPNDILDDIALDVLDGYYANAGGTPSAVRRVAFSEEMRIAGSWTRRQAEKVPVLGEVLQQIYGKVMHNSWVTTNYYLFRFALDARFHAQNYVEGPFLYMGRSGLKTAEIDQGMFGMTKAAVTREQSMEPMLATGYPFSQTRNEWLYRDLLKQQPDVLRGLVEADPKLFERAMTDLVSLDSELSGTTRAFGHTPNDYLREMDRYYNKILSSADPEAVMTAELMKELVKSPELVEVFGRIAEVNERLIGDLRSVFYGNPNRSQVERVMNNYLLYWPISYQIKATKWLLKIMYGEVGGVRTGGLGALALDRMQAEHEKRLLTDPEYGRWFEENQTLVFAAQMLLPMSPGQMSVGLSPPLRVLFFGDTKAIGEVGPVYTLTKFLPSLAGDLYPTVYDALGAGVADPIIRALGRKPPKQKASTFWSPPAP